MPAQREVTFDEVKQRIHGAIEHTVNTVANDIYIDAVRRAPVRKAFKGADNHGGRNTTRLLAKGELLGNLSATGRRLAARGSTSIVTRRSRIHAPNPTAASFHPGFKAERDRALQDRIADLPNIRDIAVGSGGRILGLRNDPQENTLTTRGRYELRSGRAIFSSAPEGRIDQSTSRAGRVTLGGRLRGEIELGPLERRGHIIRRRVVSPTRYAKYVEFGTRHAAAQPYMRPALAGARERFLTVLKNQIRLAIRQTRGTSDVRMGVATRAKRPKPVKTKEIQVGRADLELFSRLSRGE